MSAIKQLIAKIRYSWNGLMNGILLRYKKAAVGQNVQIHGRLKIYGAGQIELGDNTIIISSESANPLGGDSRTMFSLAYGGKLKIGRNVGISNSAFVCHNEIIVEDDVRIGGSTKIYDTDFHSLDYESRVQNKTEYVPSGPVRIKKGAFIGAHCIILKGVTIGEKSIVGAGSVVAKSIPDGEVWAGNPARFIRCISQQEQKES